MRQTACSSGRAPELSSALHWTRKSALCLHCECRLVSAYEPEGAENYDDAGEEQREPNGPRKRFYLLAQVKGG
jgi:hypothetical protein